MYINRLVVINNNKLDSTNDKDNKDKDKDKDKDKAKATCGSVNLSSA